LRAHWKAGFGLAISVFFIWWVLRDQDVGEIWARISRANWWYLSGAIFLGTAGYFVRAMRWKVLLHPVKPDTGLHNRFAAVCIGFAITNVIPARVGEIARPVAIGRLERMSISGAIGSVFVERLLDTIVLTTILLVPVALPSFPREMLAENRELLLLFRFAFVAIATLLGVLVALLIFPNPMVRLAERTLGRLPEPWGHRVVDALEAFLEALQLLRRPKLLTLAVLWSYGFWIWQGFSFWLGMLAFGVDAPFEAAFFTMATVGFVVALPAAPGFFGTFQFGAELALVTAYGAAAAPALAFAFGYHITTFIPITVIGLAYASKVGFSIRELSESGSARTIDRELHRA
jgi:glycosyltransferase 2 family protein